MQAVVRCLYAYFMDKAQHEIPYIDIPLHQVICLEPSTYGTLEQRIDIGPKVVRQPPPP